MLFRSGYPLRVRKLASERIETQVKETAALLEIESLLKRKPRELSGGERQRVALARAIVRHPRAFLMDEPLSNLDARLRLQMRGELKHLQQKLATTTVYVTHDQAEAMTLGHRVAVMNKGKLQQFDTPLEIYNRPANRFVAEFVGSPGMNFLDGSIDISQGCFRNRHFSLALNDSQRETLNKIDSKKRVTLGVRPENIHVSPTQRDSWHPASVYVTELMGSETFVIVQLRDAKLTARAGGDFRAEPDSVLWLEFNATKAHFFDSETGLRL